MIHSCLTYFARFKIKYFKSKLLLFVQVQENNLMFSWLYLSKTLAPLPVRFVLCFRFEMVSRFFFLRCCSETSAPRCWHAGRQLGPPAVVQRESSPGSRAAFPPNNPFAFPPFGRSFGGGGAVAAGRETLCRLTGKSGPRAAGRQARPTARQPQGRGLRSRQPRHSRQKRAS